MRPDPLKLSRFMSYVLRHDRDKIGIRLDRGGWVAIADLVSGARAAGVPLSEELVHEIVRTCDKQRYAISPDGRRIRANQGHSVMIDLGLVATEPPTVLFHGTATRFLDSIFAEGLRPGSRMHVHLSTDVPTAIKVGSRHGNGIVLSVDAKAMFSQGHEFFVSENGVWLTRHVPRQFLTLVGGEGSGIARAKEE